MKPIRKTSRDIFALCFNIALVILEITAVAVLFTVPIPWSNGTQRLANYTTFKYFTTDSNILMMIAALTSAICIVLIWKGKIKSMPKGVSIFKLISTGGVVLTMVITLFVLLPGAAISGTIPAKALFLGNNMYMHLICPLVAMVTYLLFENRTDISIKETCYCFIPVVIYGIFYLCMAYTHVGSDGKIPFQYDWYKFCSFGPAATPFIFIGVIGVDYLFNWLMWLGNRRINIKSLA